MRKCLLIMLLMQLGYVSAGEIPDFLGIPIGRPLQNPPIRPVPTNPSQIPIYWARIPLQPPYDEYFYDASASIYLKDDRVGLVRAERAFPSAQSCKEAKTGLVNRLEEVLGLKADHLAGYLFISESGSRNAHVSCGVAQGARYYVLTAFAQDAEMNEEIKRYIEANRR